MPASKVRGRDVWLDRLGRIVAAPAPGTGERFLYRVVGERLEFVGHGARPCHGCGAVLDPDPDDRDRPLRACRLCGAVLG